MPQDQIRACTFKRPFISQREADVAVKEIRKKGKMAGFSSMCAYKCAFCTFWHLGHNRRRR